MSQIKPSVSLCSPEKGFIHTTSIVTDVIKVTYEMRLTGANGCAVNPAVSRAGERRDVQLVDMSCLGH
jgi:hypothetical protein